MSARSRNLLRVGTAPLLLFAAGCSGTVVSASDASTTSTQALLSVDRTASVGDPVASARAHASASFLRMQAGADQNLAARLVGGSNLLPPLGECRQVEVLGDQGMPLASLGPVDLIDVGEVALEASQTRATLAARAFPDVVDLVSGVVYTTRDLVADSLPEQGAYSFKISGSPALAPMALEARAPGPVEELAVGGLALTGQATVLARHDLSVTWKAQPGADLVYIELASTEDGPLERVRCSFPNEGRALIAASTLPKASAQSISIHLVHREGVVAPGLDSGEIRFDLATSGSLRFEAPQVP